jgi:AcrR family transcriptional regulator
MAGATGRSGGVNFAPAFADAVVDPLADQGSSAVRPLDFAIAQACEAVTHNINGQRLGRKGRETRERIIHAAIRLLETHGMEPFALSSIAREASLGMSSLYNYFNDASELMIAVLEPVMATADDAYMEVIRDYWPDDAVHDKCNAFWRAYLDFWYSHSALLHQRNWMSDAGDERMLRHRFEAVYPLLEQIQQQLGLNDGTEADEHIRSTAAVLITGIERTMTVQTKPNYQMMLDRRGEPPRYDMVGASARLLELAIRDSRQSLRASR